METQKTANLSGDADSESSKFATRKQYVINDQSNIDYGEKKKKVVQPLNLKPTSLIQVFMIIQKHIFL